MPFFIGLKVVYTSHSHMAFRWNAVYLFVDFLPTCCPSGTLDPVKIHVVRFIDVVKTISFDLSNVSNAVVFGEDTNHGKCGLKSAN